MSGECPFSVISAIIEVQFKHSIIKSKKLNQRSNAFEKGSAAMKALTGNKLR
jgi:hypothetical protein